MMAEHYDFGADPDFVPKLLTPPACVEAAGVADIVRGRLYVAERVSKISSGRRRYPRLWIVTPAFTALCNEQGMTLRVLLLQDIERCFVQWLPAVNGRRGQGVARVVIKPRPGLDEPSQILEMDEACEPVQLLKTVSALRAAQTQEGSGPILPLPVEDVAESTDLHAPYSRFGELNRRKLKGYRTPEQKKLSWSSQPKNNPSYWHSNWKAVATAKASAAEAAAVAAAAPTAAPAPAAASSPAAGSRSLAPAAAAPSPVQRAAPAPASPTGHPTGRDEQLLRRERAARADAELRRDEAEGALATLLAKTAYGPATRLRVTRLRTEGLDSSMLARCQLCEAPVAPYCSVTGLRHSAESLVLSAGTERADPPQRATAVSQNGSAEYDVSGWAPMRVSGERDLLFSLESAGQSLGSAGVLLRDLLLPTGEVASPAHLWEHGVVVRLGPQKTGLLRLRAERIEVTPPVRSASPVDAGGGSGRLHRDELDTPAAAHVSGTPSHAHSPHCPHYRPSPVSQHASDGAWHQQRSHHPLSLHSVASSPVTDMSASQDVVVTISRARPRGAASLPFSKYATNSATLYPQTVCVDAPEDTHTHTHTQGPTPRLSYASHKANTFGV